MSGRISFQSVQTSFQLKNKRAISAWLKEAISEEGLSSGEISVVLCSDDYLLDVNRKFLEHDYLTDIITFQYPDNQSVSGDLLISIDRVADNAGKFAVSTENELHRVMVHGVLHLCGYKDKKKSDREIMRKREDYYLKKRNF